MIGKFLGLYIKNVLYNKKIFILILGTFFLGILMGNISVKSLLDEQQNELSNYIQEFMQIFMVEKVDNMEIFKISLFTEARMLLFVWLFGLSIIGIPLILFSLFIRGFYLGYTITSIFIALGKEAIFTVASIIVFKELLLAVVFVSITVVAVLFSLELMECFLGKKFSLSRERDEINKNSFLLQGKKKHKEKSMFSSYFKFFCVQLVVLILAVVVEAVFLPVFIKI